MATMFIFTFFFGRLAGLSAQTDGIPYPIFAYAALLPWTFFANAVTNSGNSLIGNANLITKVYFPRMIIPGAAVASGLVELAVALIMLVGLMLYYQVAPGAGLLLLPVLVFFTAMVALGVGLWFAALNVKYRDVRFALPFLIQLWMFVSPVIYPSSMVPEKWRWVLSLNPLTGLIEGYRSSFFNRPFHWAQLGISGLMTVLILVFASYAFRRTERSFADFV
jgi:lipopolysaccharide transport system permease protein